MTIKPLQSVLETEIFDYNFFDYNCNNVWKKNVVLIYTFEFLPNC